MIFENSTLTRIDAPTVNAGGDSTFVPGQPVQVRCCVSSLTSGQAFKVQDAEMDADAALFFDHGALDGKSLMGCQLAIVPDVPPGSPAQLFAVRKVIDRPGGFGGSLAHWEMYVKSL